MLTILDNLPKPFQSLKIFEKNPNSHQKNTFWQKQSLQNLWKYFRKIISKLTSEEWYSLVESGKNPTFPGKLQEDEHKGERSHLGVQCPCSVGIARPACGWLAGWDVSELGSQSEAVLIYRINYSTISHLHPHCRSGPFPPTRKHHYNLCALPQWPIAREQGAAGCRLAPPEEGCFPLVHQNVWGEGKNRRALLE